MGADVEGVSYFMHSVLTKEVELVDKSAPHRTKFVNALIVKTVRLLGKLSKVNKSLDDDWAIDPAKL